MTYPAGVQLSTLTFSNPITFLGNPATRTEVTVQATAGVVWAATGQPIDDFPEVMAPGPGMPGSLTAPFVDQAGFTDQAGNTFTMWAYIVTRRTWFGTAVKTVQKNWQPVLGQDTVDFDSLLGGNIGLPVSAPIVPVTSVAGLTSAVGAESLADALVEFIPIPDVTGKLDATQKGAPSGVAPLGSDSKVPDSSLPGRLQTATLNANYANYVNLAKNPDTLIAGSVTLDGSDQVTSAAVLWPDGTNGTLTITARHATGAVNAYNITYGAPATKTFTQPTITRNANGAATNVPQIVVS